MNENRVSGTMTPEDQQAVLAAIETIKQKLPFLIDLSPEERRSLPRMGKKSRGFVEQASDFAARNSGILPRAFDLDEYQRDVALIRAMSPIVIALNQLNEFADDTMVALGSDAYLASLMVYRCAKQAGLGDALDAQLDELGKRFARKSAPFVEEPAAAVAK